jgi:hypothetical protein
MKRRKPGARLAVLAASTCVIAGFALSSEVAPAVAQGPLGGSCACEPAFTIEKRQQIAGSDGGFTSSTLTGATGETVDYEITVENTGIAPETFAEFTDPHCDEGTIAGGPGTNPLAPGESTTYTCSRLLMGPGVYTNEATVTGISIFGIPSTLTSNRVVVEVPAPPPSPKPAFTIEKRQEIAGSGNGFTTSPLTGPIGGTVDYQITVLNTGNGPLKLSNFTDEQCAAETIAGGPGEASLAVGASTSYTCTRSLPQAGTYLNEATVTGTSGGAAPLTQTSNQVEVVVPPAVQPANSVVAPVSGVAPCKTSQPAFHGPTGPKRRVFTVEVSAAGIDHITFYLDGRKLKKLTQSQAKAGKFEIKIDPRKLAHGAHKLKMKAVGTDPKCGSIARSSTFVRPVSQVRAVKFTG